MAAGPAVVWFRQDLRLSDHAALAAAMEGGRAVVPLYVLDDETPGAWRLGGASRWWLHGSLAALDASLRARGSGLVLRRGRAAEVVPAVVREAGAEVVHAGRMHEPWARRQEGEVADALGGVLALHRTTTLFDLDQIQTKTGGTYGVYAPFLKACRARPAPPAPLAAPEHIPSPPLPRSDALSDWPLLPTRPDWAGGFRETWQPGEAAAHERLRVFLERAVHHYDVGRNLPGEPGSSMISPHLHWGELSPGEVWHRVVRAAQADGQDRGTAVETYLGELVWREFSAYLLWHRPALPEAPLREAFARLPFRDAPGDLRRWERGETGIPIVDAGMRQLWRIGWMHNRVRMIAASFLVKQLLVAWQAGEAWFWDTLVDADLASNAASWQWIAGTGIDSQPFFRVFNPVSQGERWDPNGAYVRRWVPELARLPGTWIHQPWKAPDGVLDAAGVRIGETYPAPMMDLGSARARALAAYRATVKPSAAAA
jgi:deoxyribodipyrimidine photo-lyase